MSTLDDEKSEYRRMYEEMGYETTPEAPAVVDPRRRPSRRCSVTEHTLRAQQELMEFMEQLKKDEWAPSQRGFVQCPPATSSRARLSRSIHGPSLNPDSNPFSPRLSGKVKKQHEVLRALPPFGPGQTNRSGKLAGQNNAISMPPYNAEVIVDSRWEKVHGGLKAPQQTDRSFCIEDIDKRLSAGRRAGETKRRVSQVA